MSYFMTATGIDCESAGSFEVKAPRQNMAEEDWGHRCFGMAAATKQLAAAAVMPKGRGTEQSSLTSLKGRGAARKVASVEQPEVALDVAENSQKAPGPQQEEPRDPVPLQEVKEGGKAGGGLEEPRDPVLLKAVQGGSVAATVDLATAADIKLETIPELPEQEASSCGETQGASSGLGGSSIQSAGRSCSEAGGAATPSAPSNRWEGRHKHAAGYGAVYADKGRSTGDWRVKKPEPQAPPTSQPTSRPEEIGHEARVAAMEASMELTVRTLRDFMQQPSAQEQLVELVNAESCDVAEGAQPEHGAPSDRLAQLEIGYEWMRTAILELLKESETPSSVSAASVKLEGVSSAPALTQVPYSSSASSVISSDTGSAGGRSQRRTRQRATWSRQVQDLETTVRQQAAAVSKLEKRVKQLSAQLLPEVNKGPAPKASKRRASGSVATKVTVFKEERDLMAPRTPERQDARAGGSHTSSQGGQRGSGARGHHEGQRTVRQALSSSDSHARLRAPSVIQSVASGNGASTKSVASMGEKDGRVEGIAGNRDGPKHRVPARKQPQPGVQTATVSKPPPDTRRRHGIQRQQKGAGTGLLHETLLAQVSWDATGARRLVMIRPGTASGTAGSCAGQRRA